jgi:hypothetical protein
MLRTRARRLALASALAVALAGCAGRETAASRAAWEKAERGGRTPGSGPGATKDGKTGGTLADPSAWRDLATFTNETAELLSMGLSTAPMKTMIAKLCAEPPEADPAVIEPEAVRCPPKPAMDPLGHPLELEIGRRGEVGRVATDLASKASSDLLAEAMKHLAGACEAGWTRIKSDAHEEFHSCTARSGSMLVVGRFVGEGGGDRWQFSLAVLGPG